MLRAISSSSGVKSIFSPHSQIMNLCDCEFNGFPSFAILCEVVHILIEKNFCEVDFANLLREFDMTSFQTKILSVKRPSSVIASFNSKKIDRG